LFTVEVSGNVVLTGTLADVGAKLMVMGFEPIEMVSVLDVVFEFVKTATSEIEFGLGGEGGAV
jgi:hypothetical protein